MRITDLSDLQKAVCANFIRGLDLITIASDSGTVLGKRARALGYILPILKLICQQEYKDNTRQGTEHCSPQAIIVVNSFNTGMAFERLIMDLLTHFHQLSFRVKFLCKDKPDDDDSRNFCEFKKFPAGRSIIITTVDCLSIFLQTKQGSQLCQK